MSKRIYVENLPSSASDDEVRALFARFGKVEDVQLMTGRETSRSRSYVVVMSDGADAAIAKLNTSDFEGRKLDVSEAPLRG